MNDKPQRKKTAAELLGPRPPRRQPVASDTVKPFGPAAGYSATYSGIIIPLLQSLPVSPGERGELLNGYLRVLSICREQFTGPDASHEALIELATTIQHRYGLWLRAWFDTTRGIAWDLCEVRP